MTHNTQATGAGAQENSTSPSQTPGAILTRAREAKNMTAGQVASLLKLDTPVVAAIDADDYSKLPVATFTKGYLRSYAKLVGVDAEQVVTAYNQTAGPAERTDIKVAKSGDHHAGVGRWLLILLLLAIVLGIAWLWSKPQEKPVSTDTISTAEVEPATGNGADALVQHEVDDSEGSSPDIAASGGSDGSMAAATEANNTAAEPQLGLTAATAEAESQATVETETTETQQLTAQAEITEPLPEPASEPEPEPEVVEPVAEAGFSVKIVASQEAWISVRDGNDERILRRLMQPGDQAVLRGEPPFNVHLGNYSGVSILVNGKQRDYSQFRRSNNTARFLIKE